MPGYEEGMPGYEGGMLGYSVLQTNRLHPSVICIAGVIHVALVYVDPPRFGKERANIRFYFVTLWKKYTKKVKRMYKKKKKKGGGGEAK